MSNKQPGLPFVITSLLALGVGVLMGSVAALQFIFPDFFELLPFFKSRPLHVSLVVSWIFLCAIGGIYYYLPRLVGLPLFSPKLARVHFYLFVLTGFAILGSYVMGKFGGREYWEFHPILSIPIVLSWILFGINYFKTVLKKKDRWPVYLWMWGTGILFFLYTFLEANLWIFSYFSDNVVREITIQWKAYGALVGSWNMLVYGTAIFVMEKISNDPKVGSSKMAYALFFLSLVNLMFGWAHHTYLVPSAPWIRYLAYGVSMSELLILGKIIWNWKSTLSTALKYSRQAAYRFLLASDIWIFLNIILALLISIPAINLYTHGTHITVAHSMGSTIGINTMVLLASVFFLLKKVAGKEFNTTGLKVAVWIVNIALLVFWIGLISAGYVRGILTMENELSFQEIMAKASPYLMVFMVAGLCLFVGIAIIVGIALSGFRRSKVQS